MAPFCIEDISDYCCSNFLLLKCTYDFLLSIMLFTGVVLEIVLDGHFYAMEIPKLSIFAFFLILSFK